MTTVGTRQKDVSSAEFVLVGIVLLRGKGGASGQSECRECKQLEPEMQRVN